MEKLCIFCEYLEYEAAGSGEYAEPAQLRCSRQHKLMSRTTHLESHSVYDIEDFRRIIMTATNCTDYTPTVLSSQSGLEGTPEKGSSVGTTMNVCPWPDFAGNQIVEGDIIQHPTGETAVVVFMRGVDDPGDQWLADYGGGDMSRLGLQIGKKGMAVVISKA